MITIEEFKNKITKKSRLIGLDLGSKRIGLSISDPLKIFAILEDILPRTWFSASIRNHSFLAVSLFDDSVLKLNVSTIFIFYPV